MKHKFLLFCLLFGSIIGFTQEQKKVLFLGNSYTAANNLPLMVSNMAASTGDELIYDSNTPGGYRFMNHATNSTTLYKINADDWDFVALQAQSQETSWSQGQMQDELYPHAETLSNQIRANNSCAQPLFYMTWGRENGDSNNCQYVPWVCTYEGMDDAIRTTYVYMAEQNNTEVAPAGAVWRYLRTHHPEIDLYTGDGSHPSVRGSYAVACTFYTMIFKKDPTLISWNSSLSEEMAEDIKLATKNIVFDRLDSWDKTAYFNETINNSTVDFSFDDLAVESYEWNFGDNQTSLEQNPSHTYTTTGDFDVTLTITRCGRTYSFTKNINISTLNVNDLENQTIAVYPNPVNNVLNIKGFDSTEVSIVIFNSLGQKVKQFKNITEGILVSDLKPGNYFVQIYNGKKYVVEQVLKQ